MYWPLSPSAEVQAPLGPIWDLSKKALSAFLVWQDHWWGDSEFLFF